MVNKSQVKKKFELKAQHIFFSSFLRSNDIMMAEESYSIKIFRWDSGRIPHCRKTFFESLERIWSVSAFQLLQLLQLPKFRMWFGIGTQIKWRVRTKIKIHLNDTVPVLHKEKCSVRFNTESRMKYSPNRITAGKISKHWSKTVIS